MKKMNRALISVYDKTGLVDLARDLASAGIEIVSTGSTAAAIADAGVAVTPVETVTGFPECLDGRVKTLHPKIHGGILADLRKEDHQEQLQELGIAAFDLVIVNLYPFTDTVASGAVPDECIEQIDIGGPAMVRAAAKNHHSVAVVVSPEKYSLVRQALSAGGFDLDARRVLAAEAFAHTASYDAAVANWFATEYVPSADGWPDVLAASWTKSTVLRYGENPHQAAALYVNADSGLANAEQIHGKEMSYNNYVDGESALRACLDFAEPAVAIIKHANPCGIAVGDTIAQAHQRAHDCDPVSAFGGVIAANRPVSVAMAEQLADVFTEVIIAPAFDHEALDILQTKKNLRLLKVDVSAMPNREIREISGGVLVQERDLIGRGHDDPSDWRLVSGEPADSETLSDLRFAWVACRSVKSNAILLANNGASVGIGMGQVNRVDSARLAVDRAGSARVHGSVAASDAFFPFADGPQILIDAGVRAIVQPGGSVRDDEVIAAAQKAGVTMYFTDTRHFFH